jgi:hypothetical protein
MPVQVAIPGLASLGLSGGLPPLGFSSSASSASGNGATFVGPGTGDWNVNLGGSGVAFQSSAGSVLLWVAIGALVAWMLKR